MNPLKMLYAIVQERPASGDPQLFVIAYPSESSLREFLVPSRIVATGYHSREEAVLGCVVPVLSRAA